MSFIVDLLGYLTTLSIPALFLIFLLENGILITGSVLIGFAFDKTIPHLKEKITRKEILWTSSTLFLNTLITLAGFLLYKYGIIHFSFDNSFFRILLDTFLLVISMDLLMFLFHYSIHKIRLLRKIHDLHHEYENPTAITLYVLNPLEVIGFGSLWIFLLVLHDTSLLSVFIYLLLNVVMGMIGHLELERIPTSWSKNAVMKWIANTTFHNDHHKDPSCNYGFYTSFWDLLFKTFKGNTDAGNKH